MKALPHLAKILRESIEEESAVIALLNESLADTIDMALRSKQAHWLISGPNFQGLHELFDKINASMLDYADLIAERAIQLGGPVEGTLSMVSRKSRLPDYQAQIRDWKEHVHAMHTSLKIYSEQIKLSIDKIEALRDQTSLDILVETHRGAEKYRWMIHAHLPEELGAR